MVIKPKNPSEPDQPKNSKKEKRKKAFFSSKEYIKSTLPPIIKNQLTEQDVTKHTKEGNQIPKKAIEIAEELLKKTDFEHLRMCSDNKNLFYFYREDIDDVKTYDAIAMRMFLYRMLRDFPLPTLRANSLLTRIFIGLRNSDISAYGKIPYPNEDLSSKNELDDP